MSTSLHIFQKRALLTDQLINQLKAHIAQIKHTTNAAGLKKQEDSLRQENAFLQAKVRDLTTELTSLEMQNGKISVSVPNRNINCLDNGLSVQTKSVPTSKNIPETKKESRTSACDKGPPAENKKKEKKAGAGNKPIAAAPASEVIDVSRLDMRVGQIVEVDKHPDADSLYVEKVNVGGPALLTVISGLVKHVSLDEMRGRRAVFLCNLKPAKMRGILSEAMIMCASTPERVEILRVPESAQVGDRVVVEGFPGTPDNVMNPKKKIWETVKPDLRVNSSGEATYKGAKWSIGDKGHVISDTLKDVAIQ